MIISNLLRALRNDAVPPAPMEAIPAFIRPESVSSYGTKTISGQLVSPELAKNVATAYRCGNILSDDIAGMPMLTYRMIGRSRERVMPDAVLRNISYLLEVSPNRWMIPFIFKKAIAQWLIYWGNAYIWQPPSNYRELYILPASMTYPMFDADGNLWYHVVYPNGHADNVPAVEVMHLMINSTDGFIGRSIITYARETIGRQMGAHETQNRINGAGLNPSAILWMNGEVSPDARNKVKSSYTDQVSGSKNAGGVAVFDNKITKFEAITMKPSDAQFLESIQATDGEIANFFGMPLYKLNQGKQSYESNSQNDLEYLKSTLAPYLTQWEQAARLKWLRLEEQALTYFRFNWSALLQTDTNTMSQYLEKQILSGQISPNEAREIQDRSAYEGGDTYFIPSNMAQITADGIKTTAGAPTAAPTTGGQK